jgi:hypothetical protein
MFFTKKKKIQKYLEQKAESDKNAFDFLLCNYLDGTLKKDLELLGITKNEIHIYRSVYRQFRLCITNASGNAHTPKVARILRLPPGGSSRRSRVRESALQ